MQLLENVGCIKELIAYGWYKGLSHNVLEPAGVNFFIITSCLVPYLTLMCSCDFSLCVIVSINHPCSVLTEVLDIIGRVKLLLELLLCKCKFSSFFVLFFWIQFKVLYGCYVSET